MIRSIDSWISRSRSYTSLTVQQPLLILVHGYAHAGHPPSPHLHYIRADPRDPSEVHPGPKGYGLIPCSPAGLCRSPSRLLLVQQNQRPAHCMHHSFWRCGECPRVLCVKVHQVASPWLLFHLRFQSIPATLLLIAFYHRPGVHYPTVYTSISILSNADDKDLPNVSLLKDREAPPSSAPCSTNLSARMLGTSKRSTFPVIMPAKCIFTRSAVTSRANRS